MPPLSTELLPVVKCSPPLITTPAKVWGEILCGDRAPLSLSLPAAPGNAEIRLGITRLSSFQPSCRVPPGVLPLGLFILLLAWLIFVLKSCHWAASGTVGAVALFFCSHSPSSQKVNKSLCQRHRISTVQGAFLTSRLCERPFLS